MAIKSPKYFGVGVEKLSVKNSLGKLNVVKSHCGKLNCLQAKARQLKHEQLSRFTGWSAQGRGGGIGAGGQGILRAG